MQPRGTSPRRRGRSLRKQLMRDILEGEGRINIRLDRLKDHTDDMTAFFDRIESGEVAQLLRSEARKAALEQSYREEEAVAREEEAAEEKVLQVSITICLQLAQALLLTPWQICLQLQATQGTFDPHKQGASSASA